MKVKELKILLNELPDDFDILIAKDEEGNGFHHFDGWSTALCEELDQYLIENLYYSEDWDDEVDNEDFPGNNCVVFWP